MENPETSSNQQKPEDGDKHDDRPRNRIQVSREKRPLNFYIGLAKKFLANEDVVELSGLGMAVTTVVTVAEILKASGSVKIDRIETSLVDVQVDGRSSAPKAKIQIWISRTSSWTQPASEKGNGQSNTAVDKAPQ